VLGAFVGPVKFDLVGNSVGGMTIQHVRSSKFGPPAPSDLEVCYEDLEDCDGDLGDCYGDLEDCGGYLDTCNGSLGTCEEEKAGLGAQLDACASSLGECDGELEDCEAANLELTDDLLECSQSLDECVSDVAACEDQAAADLAACEDELSTAQGDAACGLVLLRQFVVMSLMHDEGNGFKLKVWKIEAPDTKEEVIDCFGALFPDDALNVMDQGRYGYTTKAK